MTQKHTALPWAQMWGLNESKKYNIIIYSNDKIIDVCEVFRSNIDEEGVANAAFIVRACNEYYKNKSLAKALFETLVIVNTELSRPSGDPDGLSLEDLLFIVEQAIAKAETTLLTNKE